MKFVSQKRVFSVALAVFLILLLLGPRNDNPLRNECHRIVATLKSKKPDCTRQSYCFDANSYFQIFPRLKMFPGYQLDWLYYARASADTQPFIYARKINAPSFAYYQDYLASIGLSKTTGWYDRPLPHAMDFLQKIETDSTPEGYLQLLMLGLLGDKNSMWDHALYDDIRVVCAGFEIYDSPSVVITDKSVTIRLTTFGCLSADHEFSGGTLAVKEYILDKQLPATFTERTIKAYSGFPIWLLNEPLGMMCNTIM
jgi:hypothetical protein